MRTPHFPSGNRNAEKNINRLRLDGYIKQIMEAFKFEKIKVVVQEKQKYQNAKKAREIEEAINLFFFLQTEYQKNDQLLILILIFGTLLTVL